MSERLMVRCTIKQKGDDMDYKWLIERLSAVFGEKNIAFKEFDYSSGFAVGYIDGENVVAESRVEYIDKSIPTKFAEVKQEDGSIVEEAVEWRHKTYSLNNDPNKDKVVDDLIAKWKSL